MPSLVPSAEDFDASPATALLRSALDAEADSLGLVHRGFLGAHDLARALDGTATEVQNRYGAKAAGGALVVALAYDDGPSANLDQAEEPLAIIARFARANWYAELTTRLRACALAARRALSEAGHDAGKAGEWRPLANSRLPERGLALAAGLGSIGRSGLLLVPGPGLVLGLLLLPPALRLPDAAKPDSRSGQWGADCGSCRACVDACPTAALSAEGSFARERCIQHWASRAGALPPAVEAAWGNRLYGCDSCTESCPRFGARSTIRPTLGLLGRGISAARIARAEDGELRAIFRGSALGLSWIEPEALRRNARIALGSDRFEGTTFDARPPGI